MMLFGDASLGPIYPDSALVNLLESCGHVSWCLPVSTNRQLRGFISMRLIQQSTRRDFLKAASAAVAAPCVITSAARGNADRPPPSNRIVMAGIGIGNMGRGDQAAFLNRKDVQYVAVCDVREKVCESAKDTVDKHYNNRDCNVFRDFRELLARN